MISTLPSCLAELLSGLDRDLVVNVPGFSESGQDIYRHSNSLQPSQTPKDTLICRLEQCKKEELSRIDATQSTATSQARTRNQPLAIQFNYQCKSLCI